MALTLIHPRFTESVPHIKHLAGPPAEIGLREADVPEEDWALAGVHVQVKGLLGWKNQGKQLLNWGWGGGEEQEDKK